MNHKRPMLSWKHLALVPAIALLSLTQFTGCDGISLPIEITVELTGGTVMATDVDVSGEVTVAIGAFCDLLDADSLNDTIRQAAGDMVADLVDITAAELLSVQVNASEGDFSTFTSATLTLDGVTSLPLGSASSSDGFGTSLTLTQEMPVDLLALNGECGVANALLMGSAPAQDVSYSITATILVYTQIQLP